MTREEKIKQRDERFKSAKLKLWTNKHSELTHEEIEELKNFIRAAEWSYDENKQIIQQLVDKELIAGCPDPDHGIYCYLNAWMEIFHNLEEYKKLLEKTEKSS
jgi:predicted transcriptional regulator